jgi:hypothetical protein
MRTVSIARTMKTVCGKTISYFQEPGEVAKAHSLEGPAVIHSESDNLADEYYIYGIKYTKTRWQELVNQHKASLTAENGGLEM